MLLLLLLLLLLWEHQKEGECSGMKNATKVKGGPTMARDSSVPTSKVTPTDLFQSCPFGGRTSPPTSASPEYTIRTTEIANSQRGVTSVDQVDLPGNHGTGS